MRYVIDTRQVKRRRRGRRSAVFEVDEDGESVPLGNQMRPRVTPDFGFQTNERLPPSGSIIYLIYRYTSYTNSVILFLLDYVITQLPNTRFENLIRHNENRTHCKDL